MAAGEESPWVDRLFSQSSTGVKFSGNSDSTIAIPANPGFDVGSGEFTIAWWQKASPTQVRCPRLFQFGLGRENSDGFAVSEEGGDIYFWLDNRAAEFRGASRVSTSLPTDPLVWNHFAIVRTNTIQGSSTYASIKLYKNGVSQMEYVESQTPPDNDQLTVASSLAAPSGSGGENLRLLIGGSNDEASGACNVEALGGFNGEITGFEFYKGAKWSGDFEPPVSYTKQRCFPNETSDPCELERILLIYPISDFNTTGGEPLQNLIDDVPIGISAGVTFGDPNSEPPNQQPININLFALKSSNGQICFGLPSTNCNSSEIDRKYSHPKADELQVFFNADNGYELSSITVDPDGEDPPMSIDLSSQFTSIILGEDTVFDLEWDAENNTLIILENFVSARISAEFSSIPVPHEGLYTSRIEDRETDDEFTYFGNYVYALSDDIEPNDYSEIAGVILRIDFWRHLPIDNQTQDSESTCRFKLPFEIRDNAQVIKIRMPSLEEFLGTCTYFHNRNNYIEAEFKLYDDYNSNGSSVNDYPPGLEIQTIEFFIDSPPGVESYSPNQDIDYEEEIIILPTNLDKITGFRLYIRSEELFDAGFCEYLQELDEEDIVEDESLSFHIPTLEHLNQNCVGQFKAGITEIDPDIEYPIWLAVVDQFLWGEFNGELTLNSVNSVPENNIAPPRNIEIENFQTEHPVESHSVIETSEHTETLSTPKIDKLSEESKKVSSVRDEVLEDDKGIPTWCVKMGIWILTESGKLRICDPINEISLEVPACAGKKNTPTYPWIFRANRFIPGESDSKSGVTLHNAVFFYKGLAISGSNEVKDKPCSKGSVFIPMEYSKTVYDFAKSNKPLIWVRED